MKTRVINVSEQPPTWNWLADRFENDQMTWHACSSYLPPGAASLLRTPATRFRAAMHARGLLRNNDGHRVMVSHGPLAALYSEAFARPRDALHLVFSFNFTTLPTGVRRLLFRRYLKRADRLVVASSMERNLYSEYFDIDTEHIDLLLWSVRPPTEELAEVPRFGRDRYICAIGSQARDYETLVESMRRLPSIPLVLVASSDSLPQCSIPPNVSVVVNVPFTDAMNVLAHSSFMVLPLKGSAVPCGHVTVVSALHMGKAILATDSSGLHDYLMDGQNACLVPPGDPKALSDQIERMFNEPALCKRLGEHGLAFARTNCTEDNAVGYFKRYLASNGYA